jgi:hypothetical protein
MKIGHIAQKVGITIKDNTKAKETRSVFNTFTALISSKER